jgi:2-dehydro-3-deoxygluconokinase
MIEFNQTRAGETSYQQGFGGDTSNFIVAAARQGGDCAYLTRLGDDAFGQMFLRLWRDEGVDTRGVQLDRAAHTAVYFVSHDAQGHSFSYLRAGSAASRMTPADLDPELIRGAGFLHVSGISQAISPGACDAVFAAIEIARAAGVAVCYDANLRLKLWPLARARAIIRATIGLSDYFLPSIEDAQQFTGLDDADAILDWCFAAGAANVLLKLGKDGVIAATAQERRHIPGFAVDAVDATGAGDCFAGALVARLAAGDDLPSAARYANAAAALTTTGYGAVAPIPHADRVRALLG